MGQIGIGFHTINYTHMNALLYPDNKQLTESLLRPVSKNSNLSESVASIINRVKTGGDNAIRQLNAEFDGYTNPELRVSKESIEQAASSVNTKIKQAIDLAYSNIEKFHAAQLPPDKTIETTAGVTCSIRYRALQRVGLYIPGGTAPLISTVLMLAIPAKVAGCKELIFCTPPNPTPELLYALGLFDADIFLVGGAQAIAAMAYGTETIPRVDKIFGPGNSYVTEAKIQVASQGVPIDMPAGPSEVLVIADEGANPAFISADVLSQAEHGEDSQIIMLTSSKRILNETQTEISRQLSSLPRKAIAEKCLANSSLILVSTLTEAIAISNSYAPEHLILAVENPDELAAEVTNAGSVFLGYLTPESVGDYSSGTNHTLPTSGFARSWSGVSTLSFLKTTTYQQLTPAGLQNLAEATITLAHAEGLEAHARAVAVRLKVMGV